jgi:hypothetical protein
MRCPVCEKREIDNQGNGRSRSATCGTHCSAIRNSVSTDKLARRKYLEIHQLDMLYDFFNLNQPIPETPELLPGDMQ